MYLDLKKDQGPSFLLPWLLSAIIHRIAAVALFWGAFGMGMGSFTNSAAAGDSRTLLLFYSILDLPVALMMQPGVATPSIGGTDSATGALSLQTVHSPLQWAALLWSLGFGFLVAGAIWGLRMLIPPKPKTPTVPESIGRYDY